MGAVSLQKRRELHAMLDALIDERDGGAEGAYAFLLLREVDVTDDLGRKRTVIARGWIGRRSKSLFDLVKWLRSSGT